ncbi:MAG: hypothetical protein RXQ77_03775 [Candidatus Nanopusillus sp.]
MEEIQLYDQLFLIKQGNNENNKVKFIDKEIPNYKIYYKGKSLGTIKEMLFKLDEKIKLDEIKRYRNVYIIIMAHLLAQYIIRKIKRKDEEYANYLKQRRELLVEAIYNKILNGSLEKYKYLGKIWTDNEIKGALIIYLGDKVHDLFK